MDRDPGRAGAAGVRIDVWLAFPAAGVRFDPARQSLGDRMRWERLTGEARRREWAVSRALLAHVGGGPEVRRSLSHSYDHAALAVSGGVGAIGVDLERLAERDHERLARFAFSPEEASDLERLAPERRALHFHVLWTLKEACAKALALRLTDSLKRCRFLQTRSGWRALLPVTGGWTARVFLPRPHLVLGLFALRADDGCAPAEIELRTHEWPDPQIAPWPCVLELHGIGDR